MLLPPILNGMMPPPLPAAHPAPGIAMQRSGKAASPQIGAAMTVLATLEEAQVLPPEGTKEADHIIQSVIQLQTLFTKSADPSVQEFLRRAVANQDEQHAAPMLEQFRSNGWTPNVLEALAHATLAVQPNELQTLAAGLGSVNLSVEDLRLFMQLVKAGEQALAARGNTFHEVFASHRKAMPGAQSQ